MAFRVVQNIVQSCVRSGRKPFHKQIIIQNRCSYSDYPSYLLNSPATKLTTLPSGLRIASADGIGEIATIGLWVDAGSAHENENNSGVANFLQCVSLRGSAKRPKGSLDKDIESIGANLTGYTTRERTAFVAEAFKGDIPKVVEILAEFVQNNTFHDEDIEKTRALIRKDLAAARAKPNAAVIFDHLHAAAYQGTSYASCPLGESSTVKTIKAADLTNFVQKYYTAPNIILVGTGAVNHDELVALASKSLASLPTTRTVPFGRIDYVGSEIRIRDDTVSPLRAAFAFEVVGRDHPHYWTLMLLKTLLGSWSYNRDGGGVFLSSPLAETIATEKLAYEFHAFYQPYNNTGLFGVYAESTNEKIDDLTYEIFNQYQKLATYMTSQEIQRAKNQLKLNFLSCLQAPKPLANDLANNVLSTSRALSIAEQFKRIDAIEVSDLQHLLDTYLTDVDPVVVGHGPIENLPDYNIMRSWTYWNRW